MVVVAQLAELSVVVRAVVGSSPIDHPKIRNAVTIFLECARMGAPTDFAQNTAPYGQYFGLRNSVC